MHSGITQGVRRSQDTYRGHRYPLTDGAGDRAELPQSEDYHLLSVVCQYWGPVTCLSCR